MRQSKPLAKSRLLWPVLNAIKEQEEQIERQQAQLKRQQQQIDALKNEHLSVTSARERMQISMECALTLK